MKPNKPNRTDTQKPTQTTTPNKGKPMQAPGYQNNPDQKTGKPVQNPSKRDTFN